MLFIDYLTLAALVVLVIGIVTPLVYWFRLKSQKTKDKKGKMISENWEGWFDDPTSKLFVSSVLFGLMLLGLSFSAVTFQEGWFDPEENWTESTVSFLRLIRSAAAPSFLVVWLVMSFWNIIEPTQVGMRKWFGHPERSRLTSDNGMLGSGLHFVPWLPGIKLILIPSELIIHEYFRDPDKDSWEISGDEFQVRSLDNQKLGVEASFAIQFPFDDIDCLIKMIKAGVPFHSKPKLKRWTKDIIAPDVLQVIGTKKYLEVAGGRMNDALDHDINDRLQGKKSTLVVYGLLKGGVQDDSPGKGVAYFKTEYIHVSRPLGKKIEQLQVAALEAEAAKSEAERDALYLDGPVNIAMEKWIDQEVQNAGEGADRKDVIKALKQGGKDSLYATKLRELHEVWKLRLPGSDYQVREKRVKIDFGDQGQGGASSGGGGSAPDTGGGMLDRAINKIVGAVIAATAGKEDDFGKSGSPTPKGEKKESSGGKGSGKSSTGGKGSGNPSNEGKAPKSSEDPAVRDMEKELGFDDE